MGDVLLRNGIVARARAEPVADVRIRDGLVTEVGPALASADDDVELDVTGCWVGPAFVDVHTHLREPGGLHKEDIETGSAAAAAGGYSAVVAMPNTVPPIDNGGVARLVAERGRAVGLVDVFPSGTLTAGRAGLAPANFDDLWDAGARMFTDDGDTVADGEVLRRAMERLARLGGVVSQHAIDPTLAAGGHLHDGVHARRLDIAGIPSEAETEIVARDIELVRRTGATYHLQHVSCGESVGLVAAAKAEGLPITAEVTPHHLAFSHADLAGGDTHLKMMPPLRTIADRDALRDGVREGIIDVVATDHAPHAPHEKERAFEEAAFGVTGLENASSVVNSTLRLPIRPFFERLSVAPARLARARGHGQWIEPGADACIVVFDPDRVATPTTTRSRSSNNPYLGRAWRGVTVLTMLRGKVTHRADEGRA